MQVIYFLFVVEKFQCLFELISVSFYLCNLCYASFCIAFAEWKWCIHLRDNRNSHFNTSNYIRSVVGEVHLLNLIIFLSICLILDISIHGRKNKTCVTKTLFTNFTRRNCFLQVWKNLFIVLKIRPYAKLTCMFVNCDENKKIFACCFPQRLFSRSLLSVVQS